MEQVINNIRPRIEGVLIHPVRLKNGQNGTVYVVDIPQSNTAHQATDLKYYKRFNFQSVAMYDHEIRDVLARGQFPIIDLDFRIEVEEVTEKNEFAPGITYPFGPTGPPHDEYTLYVEAKNVGNVNAKYMSAFFIVPKLILGERGSAYWEEFKKPEAAYYTITANNIQWGAQNASAHYVPLLPGMTRQLTAISFSDDFKRIPLDGLEISWSIFADNAPGKAGTVKVKDISFVRKSKK